MTQLTVRERSALAAVLGCSALHLEAAMDYTPAGRQLCEDVTVLLALIGFDYLDFLALVMVGKELLGEQGQGGCGCGRG
jgi:hypothetical protein